MANTNGVKEAVAIKVEPKSPSIKLEPKSPLQLAPSSQSTVLKAGPDEKPRDNLWGQNPFSLQSRQGLKTKSTGVSSSNRFSALKETDEDKLSINPLAAGKKRASKKERKRLSWMKTGKKKKNISDVALDKIVDAINDVGVKDMCTFVDFKKNNAALNNGGSKSGANVTVKTKKIENSRKRKRRLNKRQKAALKKNNERTDANTKANKSASNNTQASANTGSQNQWNAVATGKKKKKKKRAKQNMDNQGKQNAGTGNSLPGNKAHNVESMETSENTDATGKKKRRRKKKKPGQNQGEKSTEASKTLNYENMETTANTNVNKQEKKKNRQGNKRKNKRSTENSEVGAANPETNSNANMECSDEDDSPQPAKKLKMIHNIIPKLTSTYIITPPKLNLAHGKNRRQDIRASWQGDESKSHIWKDTKTEVIKKPFTCCYMPAFLNDPSYLNKVKEELMSLELITKNNDLYKFHQTSDLKSVISMESPHIAGLRDFLYGEFREWLIQVTGIPLNSTVDMGSSRYEYTDTLLCHDDELEGRRIAYILYLVPPWSKEDGGTLDLFNTDENGQPNTIARSLVPEWNAFAFFEVSPVSFHQVSEVLSQDKVRLSINGWFHGPPIERPERYTIPPPSLLYPGHIEEEEIYAWVNHLYLDQKSQQEIRRKFRTESALELENFITEDKYEELEQAFKSAKLNWKRVGPSNKQNCEILDIEGTPEVIRNCADLLKSEAFFLILSQLTGLKFHSLAPPDSEPDSEDDEEQVPNPRSSLSLHRWGPGSYTLVRDDCVEGKSALDVNLFINVAEKWSLENGGFLTYITKDQDEELLTVSPRANCLALVYRDAQTLRFTKHINASVKELGDHNDAYHTMSGVYYE